MYVRECPTPLQVVLLCESLFAIVLTAACNLRSGLSNSDRASHKCCYKFLALLPHEHMPPPPHTHTNDRCLEEAILNFAGSTLVISHDRWFLDR